MQEPIKPFSFSLIIDNRRGKNHVLVEEEAVHGNAASGDNLSQKIMNSGRINQKVHEQGVETEIEDLDAYMKNTLLAYPVSGKVVESKIFLHKKTNQNGEGVGYNRRDQIPYIKKMN